MGPRIPGGDVGGVGPSRTRLVRPEQDQLWRVCFLAHSRQRRSDRLNRRDLERLLHQNRALRVRVIGWLRVTEDVDGLLAERVDLCEGRRDCARARGCARETREPHRVVVLYGDAKSTVCPRMTAPSSLPKRNERKSRKLDISVHGVGCSAVIVAADSTQFA